MAYQMKRPRFKSVKPLDDFKIQATFINDSIFTIDFKPFFEESAQLRSLLGNQEAFNKVTTVASEGWTVEWEDLDIQIGADTLWLDAQVQNAPDENTRIFSQWRVKHGFSLADAARVLGIRPQTISSYGNGKRPVPLYIALACKGWEVENKN
ncbi:MAG: DUF2442 domain-containing protein [Methylococcaceae bacterium]